MQSSVINAIIQYKPVTGASNTSALGQFHSILHYYLIALATYILTAMVVKINR